MWIRMSMTLLNCLLDEGATAKRTPFVVEGIAGTSTEDAGERSDRGALAKRGYTGDPLLGVPPSSKYLGALSTEKYLPRWVQGADKRCAGQRLGTSLGLLARCIPTYRLPACPGASSSLPMTVPICAQRMTACSGCE